MPRPPSSKPPRNYGGEPKKKPEDAYTERIVFGVLPGQDKEIRLAAFRANVSLSEYCRDAILDRMKKEGEEHPVGGETEHNDKGEPTGYKALYDTDTGYQ